MSKFLTPTDGKAAKLLLQNYGALPRGVEVLREVTWILDRLADARVPIGVRTYTTAVDILRKQGAHSGARALFSRMEKMGIEPDSHSFDALLSACVTDAHHFSDCLKRKRKAGFEVTSAELFMRVWHMTHLKHISPTTDVMPDVRAAIAEATALSIPLDTYHYGKIVQCCNTVSEADALVSSLQRGKRAIRLNEPLILALLKVARRAGNYRKASAYLEKLRGIGCDVEIRHIREVAAAYRIGGRHSDAERIWAEADASTYLRRSYDLLSVVERLSNLADLLPGRALGRSPDGGARPPPAGPTPSAHSAPREHHTRLLQHAWDVFSRAPGTVRGSRAETPGTGLYSTMADLIASLPDAVAEERRDAADRLEAAMASRRAILSAPVVQSLARAREDPARASPPSTESSLQLGDSEEALPETAEGAIELLQPGVMSQVESGLRGALREGAVQQASSWTASSAWADEAGGGDSPAGTW